MLVLCLMQLTIDCDVISYQWLYEFNFKKFKHFCGFSSVLFVFLFAELQTEALLTEKNFGPFNNFLNLFFTQKR